MPIIKTYDGLFCTPRGLFSAELYDAQDFYPPPGWQHRPTRPEARMIKKIGERVQGDCFLMESLSTGKPFVFKKVPREAIPFMRRQPLEALVLDEVLGRYKRLINLIDWQLLPADIRGPPQVMMMYKYYAGGDLAALVPKCGSDRVPEMFLWHVFLQLADGFSWLHYGIDPTDPDDDPPRGWQRIIHGDLKPDNVFLSKRVVTEESISFPCPR